MKKRQFTRLFPQAVRVLKNVSSNERQLLRERFGVGATFSNEDIENNFQVSPERLKSIRQKRFAGTRFSKPIKPNELEEAYMDGMLRKDQLEDGAYYRGICRNAEVAKWSADVNAFLYVDEVERTQSIRHPEDDNGFDLFIPFEKTEPKDKRGSRE